MASKKEPLKKYPCILCGRDGFTEHQMKAHIALEHFDSVAACPFCNGSCTSPANLVRHIEAVHHEVLKAGVPCEDTNLSAHRHSSVVPGTSSKQIGSPERHQRKRDLSLDETSRFDLLGIPTPLRLNNMETDDAASSDQDDVGQSVSESSLNTDEVNKLMIRRSEASHAHSKTSGSTKNESCFSGTSHAAPGKYFFGERNRSPSRLKLPSAERKENLDPRRDIQRGRGLEAPCCQKGMNNISDTSDSEERVGSHGLASNTRKESLRYSKELCCYFGREDQLHWRQSKRPQSGGTLHPMSSLDVRQPPFGGRPASTHDDSQLVRSRQSYRQVASFPPSPHRSSPSLYVFNCPICPYGTDCKQSIVAHVQDLHGEELDRRHETHQCPLCQREFKFSDDLRSHVYSVHNDVLKTPENKRKLDGASSSRQAVQVPERKDAHQTARQLSPVDHSARATLQGASQDKQVACLLCGAVFTGEKNLLQHTRQVHSDRKSPTPGLARKTYCCMMCDGEFASRESLQVHMQEVHGSNPATPCDLSVPDHKSPAFSSPGVSRQSLQNDCNDSSSPTISFSLQKNGELYCTQCDAKFSTKDDRQRHLVWVHNGGPEKAQPGKPYVCRQCRTEFASPEELQQHVQRMHISRKERPSVPKIFKCAVCESTFPSRLVLRKHIERLHGSHHKRLSSSNVSGHNHKSPPGSSSEIRDAMCPVCQKVMPNTSAATLQAHVDSHFNDEEEEECDRDLPCTSTPRPGDSWAARRYNTLIAQGRGPPEVDQSQFLHHCFPQSKQPGTDDGISRTEGIIERLQEYYRPSLPDSVAHVWLCAPIAHFASCPADRGWGCGYRNFQMMMSCLINRREYYAALLQGPGYMPSIGRIQTMLEEAWQNGFDPDGRQQFDGVVFDTCKWIGATEIVTILSHCGIRTKLADFPQPSDSDGTHPALFKWVLHYFTSPSLGVRPPLYLQHQGHSRTIVGIEQLEDGDLRLLVFDPGTDTKQMDRFKWSLTYSTVSSIRRGLNSLRSKQYQILAIDGLLSEEERERSKVIRSERIT